MTVLLSLLALTPLVFTGSGIFPYVTDKALFIRLVVSAVSVWFFVNLLLRAPFREKMSAKIRVFLSDPLFLSVCAYFLLFILTAFLAVDKFSAFFGTVARQEGVIGMIFFFGFFIFATALFGEKEWLRFIKISLLTAVILFGYQLIQFLQGMERPSSFIGNPIFVSVYYLFAIMAAAIVYSVYRQPRNNFWLAAAGVAAIASLAGIFMANSRGVMVGLAVAVLAVLALGAFWSSKWRRFALTLLGILIIFGGVFLVKFARVTFKNPDSAVSARFNDYKISLAAINPAGSGLKKFLLGWGPENFPVAFNTYFNPRHEVVYNPYLSDRVHNQILNVFVTNGLFGFLSYLAIWFFVFRRLLQGKRAFVKGALVFFGVAYFTQNLFAFDGMTNYIPFFSFLGFIINLERK